MTDFQLAVVAHAAVKGLIVCAGTLCVFFGYKLFEKGVYRGGADLNIRASKSVLAMDRGGPGLVFALFGAIVIVAGVVHTPMTTIEMLPDRSDPMRSPDGSAPKAVSAPGRLMPVVQPPVNGSRLMEHDIGY